MPFLSWTGGSGAANYAGLFGDGSDGSATLDGVATVSWANLASNIYTLTAPAYLTSLTINNGVTLKMNGWYFFCTGTVINNGTVSELGNNAVNGSGGSATTANLMVLGGSGGSGTTTAGAAGQNAGTGFNGFGAGGNGGTSGANAGGAGAGSGPAFSKRLRNPTVMLHGSQTNIGGEFFGPGSGGGGGGGDGANVGGGGGGGGGFLVFWAHALTNTGTISTRGGNGANGTGGNAAGGGAGGGGNIVVYTLSAWNNTGTITTAAGTIGNGVGTGGNGLAGQAGVLLNVIVQ